jgi:glycerol-3-phosphate acyltransferase PlsY
MAVCGALAIVGHVWTVFLGFRGGKGVATSAGVFAALLPVPMVPTVLVFIAGTALSGHISVGSILGALALPLTALLYGSPGPLTALALSACVLILVRHIPNMKRLLDLYLEK